MPTWPRRVEKRPILTKRRKFVLVSLLLSFGLIVIQRLPIEERYSAIVGFAVASYFLTAWSLLSELRGSAWLTNMILPTFYPVSVALFYFLLPAEPVTRWIVTLLFAISMYGLLLTANIFAVASIRTIQLLRAARAVGFLLTVLSAAFLYHVIFSLRVSVGIVAPLVFLATFPLVLQGVWSYSLTGSIKRETGYATVGSIVITEMATALSFWLIDIPMASVMLSMAMYVVLGIFQHDVEERLFTRTIQEYVGFAAIVFLVVAGAVFLRWMG